MAQQRIVITLSPDEYKKLQEKISGTSFTPSQAVKNMVLRELEMPQTTLPLETLIKTLDDYIFSHPGGELYVFTPFLDQNRWYQFDTSTKRTLSWHLRKMEKSGYCKKKESGTLKNGTNLYKIVEQGGGEK